MDDTLMQYIATERSRGVADTEIKKALLERGWDAGKVGAAFGENILHAAPVAAQRGFFVGRVSRREYFFASVILLLLQLGLFFGGVVMLGISIVGMGHMYPEMGNLEFSTYPIIVLLYFALLVVMLFMGVSLVVRRLYDLGREWFWIFLFFIPFVSFIFALYLFFFKGEQHANAYGPVPNNSRSIFGVLLGH